MRTGTGNRRSLLRCTPVEMTKLRLCDGPFPWKINFQYRRNFVISTGVQRSGEMCGFLFRFARSRKGNGSIQEENVSQLLRSHN
jgi:hypothetical protein